MGGEHGPTTMIGKSSVGLATGSVLGAVGLRGMVGTIGLSGMVGTVGLRWVGVAGATSLAVATTNCWSAKSGDWGANGSSDAGALFN